MIQDDIVYELKAVKNDCEIEGMKQAHVSILISDEYPRRKKELNAFLQWFCIVSFVSFNMLKREILHETIDRSTFPNVMYKIFME